LQKVLRPGGDLGFRFPAVRTMQKPDLCQDNDRSVCTSLLTTGFPKSLRGIPGTSANEYQQLDAVTEDLTLSERRLARSKRIRLAAGRCRLRPATTFHWRDHKLPSLGARSVCQLMRRPFSAYTASPPDTLCAPRLPWWPCQSLSVHSPARKQILHASLLRGTPAVDPGFRKSPAAL